MRTAPSAAESRRVRGELATRSADLGPPGEQPHPMSFRESIRRRAGRQPSPGRGTCHVSAPQPRPGGSTTTSTYAHRHGGSGTADGALAAGVPVVVVRLFADQFENGRRLADGGAGLVVAATEATDAPRSSPDRAGGRTPHRRRDHVRPRNALRPAQRATHRRGDGVGQDGRRGAGGAAAAAMSLASAPSPSGRTGEKEESR
jgi:hypothetical protein